MEDGKTVFQVINEALDAMCDLYCKFPDEYLSKYKDPQDAMDAMNAECCADCPIFKIK